MADPPLAVSEQTLMHEMGLTEQDIARRQQLVGLVPDDLRRISLIRDLVVSQAAEFSAVFFAYLSALEEAQELFRQRELLETAKTLKIANLAAMVAGDYGRQYVEQRLRLGILYSQVRLDCRVFLGAFHHLLRTIGRAVLAHSQPPEEGFERFMALKKIAFFDIGLIVDVLIGERERLIRHQQAAIRALSTPVLQLRDRLLMLPIIGLLDTNRASQLTASLLSAIRTTRAKVIVIDVTGVAAVDTQVATHLLQTVAACKLMGATGIVTGLSVEVAQTLANLGVDLTTLNTRGNLQSGLEAAERALDS
jgi:rsbT co-antagonist protein RsbR